MTILLVDDDETVRELLERVLRSHGYAVLTAATGEAAEAIAATSAAAVDLLVCDVYLPGLSGLELAPRLAAAYPALRILLISGDPSLDGPARDAVAAATFMSKPFTTERFIECVRALLAG